MLKNSSRIAVDGEELPVIEDVTEAQKAEALSTYVTLNNLASGEVCNETLSLDTCSLFVHQLRTWSIHS